MFIRRKSHRSGNIGVIAVEKVGGKMKGLVIIGVADDENEANNLADEAHEQTSKKDVKH